MAPLLKYENRHQVSVIKLYDACFSEQTSGETPSESVMQHSFIFYCLLIIIKYPELSYNPLFIGFCSGAYFKLHSYYVTGGL